MDAVPISGVYMKKTGSGWLLFEIGLYVCAVGDLSLAPTAW